MKTINSRKVVMLLGGILTATLAAGCFGGGPGYSNDPYGYGGYGYNSNYSGYGNSYPYRDYDSGYSYPQSYQYSYRTVDRDRDNDRHAVVVRDRGESRAEPQHSGVAHEKYSSGHSEPGHRRSERN